MIADDDRRAAALVAEIAWRSARRVDDGLGFWAANGYLVRRLRRYAHRDLASFVSRMLGDCGVGAADSAEIAGQLQAMTDDEGQQVLRAIRERGDLIAALAFEMIRAKKKSRPASPDLFGGAS